MASVIATIDSQHEDMIHDSQFDYYAKKLATCSSDRTIKIFEVVGDKYILSSTLTGHEGPVWQVSWAHPKFGVLLASCSYDGSVLIHRESPANTWTRVHEYKCVDNSVSVNSVAWAPHELGLVLACASSDGRVIILEYKQDMWSSKHFQNDSLGCNSVSWAPANAMGSVSEDAATGTHTQIRRLVTGSCDNTVRIWRSVGIDGHWTEEPREAGSHSDWVRDVAWAPNTAMPYNIIASCSEDRSVLIWKQSQAAQSQAAGSPSPATSCGVWVPQVMATFDAPVWRVSWSVTGNVLAVSTGDHKVTLWKQSVDESWMQISTVGEGQNGTGTTTTH